MVKNFQCGLYVRDAGTVLLNYEISILIVRILYFYCVLGAKGDWDFRISDLVKNPDGTDI